jgi:hypothetical protein
MASHWTYKAIEVNVLPILGNTFSLAAPVEHTYYQGTEDFGKRVMKWLEDIICFGTLASGMALSE